MSTTDDIKSRIDLVDYVQRHVPLKKSGRNYKACCPFHNEKTASFVVNPVKQSWRCYGACADGGDLFTFAQKMNGWDFKEALRELGQQAGVELPVYNQKPVNQKHQRQLDLLDDLATSYTKMLQNYDGAAAVREYLRARNISTDSIQSWRLGYAPELNIIPKLLSKGHRLDDLLELGIAYKHESTGQVRSRFYNRLMIPIVDRAGQVVGFGARQLDHGQGAKYVNSNESDIFRKSSLLYGWHTARQDAQWTNQLIIVEGYMDAIQAHQAGHSNVVAQMGTALTEDQIKQITDTRIDTLILCLDGDDAGQQATDRAIDNLIEHANTKDIRIVVLPEGQDPDTIIQSGHWNSLIESAHPIIDYLINRATLTLNMNASLGQRHTIANQLIPKLYKLDDNTSKLWSIQQLASALNMNAHALVDTAQQLMTAKQPVVATILAQANEHPIEAYVIRCLIENRGWYWDLLGCFEKCGLGLPSRLDFVAYGDIYQQIADEVEGNTEPMTYDFQQIADDTTIELSLMLTNALRLRLNRIQDTMNELVEMQEIEQFSAFLAQRTHLTRQLAEMRS